MLEIGFAPCLCPFSTATVEGHVFWLPGNLHQKTVFLLQTLLSKTTLKSPYTVYLCTSANGQLKYLYSLPQEGARWGVSQAGHQSPVTSSWEQPHPFSSVGQRNIIFAVSQSAQD